MSDDPANPFWDFSLRAYRRSGVAEACLRLQDRHNLDVNLLFFVCWLAGVRARAMTTAEIEGVDAATDAWRVEVVKALRGIRRRMKHGFDGMPHDRTERLRTQVKRLELECERFEQDFLFQLEQSSPDSAATPAPSPRTAMEYASQNVLSYLAVLGVEPDQRDREDCRSVVEGCFGA